MEKHDIGSEYDKAGYDDEVDLYLDCMNELKKQCLFISKYIVKRENLRTDTLDTTIEIICLKYRKIFELISISSLITNKKKFTKKHDELVKNYKPAFIIKGMTELNSDFFPIAIKVNKIETGYDLVKLTGDILSIEDLKNGWILCSNYLHTRNPFKPKLEVTIIMDSFFKWYQKIVNLFSTHSVQLESGKHFIVNMNFSNEKIETLISYAWSK